MIAFLVILLMIMSVQVAWADESPPPEQPLVAVEAEKAYAEKKYDEALKLFKDAPNVAHRHYGIGLCYEMLSKPDKAEGEYKLAIEEDPVHYMAMENLAALYERNPRTIPQAIKLYSRALAVDPRPEWRTNLAVWIKMLKSRSRKPETYAVGSFRKATEAAENGRIAEALAMYTRSISLDSDMYQAYFARGRLRLDSGDVNRAIDDFMRVSELSPKFRGAFVQLALAWEQAGEDGKALEYLQRAHENDPKDAEALYQLGRFQQKAGNFEAALEHYSKAMTLHHKPRLKRLILEQLSAAPREIKKKINRNQVRDR